MITPELIRKKALKFWDNQKFLRSEITKQDFFPLHIPVGNLSSKKMLENFSFVQESIKILQKESKETLGKGYDIQCKEINHRKLGKQILPHRISIGTKTDFLFLINKEKAYDRFQKGFQLLTEALPELFPLLQQKPMIVLKYYNAMPSLINVCTFFRQNPNLGNYIRELDIPGVDTKFIETHKPILREMLNLVLPPQSVNDEHLNIANHSFEKRFNLKFDMPLIRFRILDPDIKKAFQLEDVSTTIEEFATLSLPVEKVFVTENKINGLSFPTVKKGMVIFGKGYGIQSLQNIDWLIPKQIFYWGDIDTHGFAILSMVRRYLPNTSSFLMDRKTLFHFKELWGKEQESKRTSAQLSHLTRDEQSLYRELIKNTHGKNIRLEQERISHRYLKHTLGAMI